MIEEVGHVYCHICFCLCVLFSPIYIISFALGFFLPFASSSTFSHLPPLHVPILKPDYHPSKKQAQGQKPLKQPSTNQHPPAPGSRLPIQSSIQSGCFFSDATPGPRQPPVGSTSLFRNRRHAQVTTGAILVLPSRVPTFPPGFSACSAALAWCW